MLWLRARAQRSIPIFAALDGDGRLRFAQPARPGSSLVPHANPVPIHCLPAHPSTARWEDTQGGWAGDLHAHVIEVAAALHIAHSAAMRRKIAATSSCTAHSACTRSPHHSQAVCACSGAHHTQARCILCGHELTQPKPEGSAWAQTVSVWQSSATTQTFSSSCTGVRNSGRSSVVLDCRWTAFLRIERLWVLFPPSGVGSKNPFLNQIGSDS